MSRWVELMVGWALWVSGAVGGQGLTNVWYE